jgi:hypothetical protein
MSPRRSRMVRPSARSYPVTDRDREILFAVGRMGQATADQIRRLFFGCDRSTALRRLAKLVALRLLDVRACHLEEPNVYILAPKARVLLVSSGIGANEIHRSKVGRHLDVHVRMLNDLRLELFLACRRRADITLEAFHGDLDLRRAGGSPPPTYLPDAIAEMITPAGPLALVIEVDTGFEGRSVFRSKVETTVALWRAAQPCWGAPAGTWSPVVFVPTPTRARSLARAIAEAGGGALWSVAEFDRLREVGVLGPILALAGDIVAIPRGLPILYGGTIPPVVLSFAPPDQEAPQ